MVLPAAWLLPFKYIDVKRRAFIRYICIYDCWLSCLCPQIF